MSASSSSLTISDSTVKCFEIFNHLARDFLISSHFAHYESSIRDLNGRFKVWASNLGAHQHPHSTKSLDFRLRESPLMQGSVLSGLRRLHNCALEACRILRGDAEDRTIVGEKQETTELDELFLSVRSSVDHLFRLSILIRKQRPKGRVQAQDNRPQVEQSPDITNVTDRFPKTKQAHWLAVRLGNATAQRRQHICYRQSHRARLGKAPETDPGDQAPASVDVASGTLATTFEEPGDLKENLDSAGLASDIEVSDYADRKSVVTAATSLVSLGSDDTGVRIPDLTDMTLDGVQLDYGREFECPYCRTIQMVAKRLEWKRHIFNDLQPYICTFPDCPTPTRLFPTRSEWFQHETDAHRRQWVCMYCSGDETTTFPTADELNTHFTHTHSKTATPSQLAMVARACERPMKIFDASACPFCSTWEPVSPPTTNDNGSSSSNAKQLRNHLARHLQNLALDALSLSIDGLEIREPEPEPGHETETEADNDTDLGSDGASDYPDSLPEGGRLLRDNIWSRSRPFRHRPASFDSRGTWVDEPILWRPTDSDT